MSNYIRHVTQMAKPLSSRLPRIDIELTERCNNRCMHCYINQPENDSEIQSREMDTGFVQSVLSQAADLGCLSVRFTGGEPLLREDFTELYLFARRLGMKVLVFTNACLINTRIAELFSRIPPGEPIQVSVYGMHATSYDAVAGVRGAYARFREGISLLQEFGIPFAVRQSMLPPNQTEIPEFEAFAATLPAMRDKPSYAMNFDLRARRDDESKNRAIRRMRVSPEESLAMLTREPDRYLREMRQFVAKFMGPSGDKIFACGAGHGTCVDAYGNAQMCLLLRHPETVYSLDPLHHRQRNPDTDLEPLAYALTRFFPQVRKRRTENPKYLKHCAVCFLKGLCDQCPAKSWEEHGTLDTTVEYLCRVAHVQAVYLGLIKPGENAWDLAPEKWKKRVKYFICGPDK